MSYEDLMLDPFGKADNRALEEFTSTERHVESLLRRYTSTRGSDKILIIHYLESMGVRISDRVKKRLIKELPSFETITRARRKIQARHLELRPSEEVQERRIKMQSYVQTWVKEQND